MPRTLALTWSTQRGLLAALVICAASTAPNLRAAESAEPLSAAESDPRILGWMQGFPPPPDKVIRATDPDFFSFPKIRWAVCHIRELLPTVRVSRGLGAPRPLPRAIDPEIDAITFTPLDRSAPMTWAGMLTETYADGIVVLHRGRIVYERYFGCLDDAGVHAAMSVTKSLTGLLAEILIAEGALDETARVDAIVPELASSAFGDATVRQVLDMTTGLRFSEDYSDPEADIWRYNAAASPLPKPAGYEGPRGYFDFLQTVRRQGEHGEHFGYRTINTDALGWITSRVSGRSVDELLSERIWSRMGAEQDAYMTVDGLGTPFAGGGLNAGLRDLARIGQLMLDQGVANGERLFPAEVVRRIREGGDREAFARGYPTLPGASYRSMWWSYHNGNDAFAARGVHGQTIYVDPRAKMVIVRFASHPTASNAANDLLSLPAYEALARHLFARP